MKLVWRRAREARGLLAAAVAAALVAVVLVAGLSEYNRRAVESGQRALLASAPVEERSLLVTGSGGADPAEFTTRDRAVREGFTAAFGGAPVTVAAARYGTGRELTGDLGEVRRTDDDPAFANLATLDDLPRHADLVAGAWPPAGSGGVTLPEKVAGLLGLAPGDRIPIRDRRSDRDGELVLTGTWRPRDLADPYWRLAPGVAAGAGAEDGSSFGPFVLDPADFVAAFPGSASASWVVVPDLAAVGASRLAELPPRVAAAAVEVPEQAGLGSSAQTVTRIDRLLDRISRADLTGRSALATPLLLILVLGGYALVLIAALLHQDRRPQTALLRARGAARRQLAGLAAREAFLVVVPAAVLGPVLAEVALSRLGAGGPVDLSRADTDTTLLWAAAAGTAAGCLATMVLPALRGAETYVADLAARSRPTRSAAVQRAGVDLVLVGFAVLAWTQLRQYASPVAGAGGRLGIDPLLVAAPTLGVLAGAVVALRLLPPVTRFAERFVDRRPWTATMFGMWQAGRRPHAGPVLLLALAVGGSTLAWSLVATADRSQVDRADHTVGADLRLVERRGAAPADRATRLAELPGVDRALPAWSDEIRVSRADLETTVVSLDFATAGGVVRLADRLADEPSSTLFDRLVRSRAAPAGLELPAGTRTLTGTLRTPVREPVAPHPVSVFVLITQTDGAAWRLPVAVTGSDGRPARFTVALPEAGPGAMRLAGFELDAGDIAGRAYRMELAELASAGADGRARPVSFTGDWTVTSGDPTDPVSLDTTTGGLTAEREVGLAPGGRFAYQVASRFVVVPSGENRPPGALMTPAVRAALGLRVGDTVTLALSGATLPVRLVGELDAVPSTSGAGILLDLPAATDWLVRDRGVVRPTAQWWLSTDRDGHTEAARAAAGLAGITVLDRRVVADEAAADPYWQGARTGLLAAALGSVLLALVGLVVDVWATTRQRLGEFAVLHTLGAGPRLLARALLAEQTFLAGIGVGVGLLLGAVVGAAMAPLVVLTPAADRPVPEAAFVLPWQPVGLTAAGLLLAALAVSVFIALGIRQRVAAAQLRIGGDR
ncbi:ABC transporter permease [Micromonospora psammae]|uniref:ABC transporter permease n=1 Tax=Micromonospora sp. CPCC 205556 TaxID=3122398 RepID=UPI002FF1959C